MIRTALTRLLGIEHPIVLGGMGSGTNVELVAAVSEAGGLGILGASNLAPDAIVEAAAAIRQRTSRPFGLNLLLGLTTRQQLEACLTARVPVLSTAWGEPAAAVRQAHQAGIPVLHMVQSAAQAGQAAAAGVDMIVAQGAEGGGHVGDVATLVLVPAVIDAAGGRPVLAAGGIADGRGVAAALALGAAGALLGTRFLATTEAPVPDFYKQAIVRAAETDTAHSHVPDLVGHRGWLALGAWARGLRTPGLAHWLGREAELTEGSATTQAAAEAFARARAEGRADDSIMLAGQAVGLIHAIEPAGAVVQRLAAEAETILRDLAGLVSE